MWHKARYGFLVLRKQILDSRFRSDQTPPSASVATLLFRKTPDFTLKKKQKIIKKTRHKKYSKKSKPNLKSMLQVLAHQN